jgi:DNA-binding SARP family transcriptional activator/tetratricopeptide (TPR) repeat protein
MAPIRIHLLGGFLLEHDGRNMPPIPSAAGRSLFAYLVTNRGRRHTRDLVAGTFWPDLPEQGARRRLSQAWWQIQTSLQDVKIGQPFIEATLFDVAFVATDYWLDIAEFDRHIATAAKQAVTRDPAESGSLEQAVDLYRGEFLAGFYDDWTHFERERLRSQYLVSLERLIALHKSRADYETAQYFARRLCLHDPLRESAHREVMRLSFLLGHSNEALRQYERCAEILSEELGRRPSSETEDLRIHIAQMREKGESPFAPTINAPLLNAAQRIPLVGRTEERSNILRRMEDTLHGRGGVILIEGESGIGKSRLVEELIDDAQWRGLSPLLATCSEAELLHPLQGLRRALESGLTRLRFDQLQAVLHRSTLAELAELVPHIRGWLTDSGMPSHGGNGNLREQHLHTIRSALFALADLNPMVLFIDDAQWLDEESAAVLAELAPDIADHSLLIGLSYRDSEVRDRPAMWRRLLDIDARTNTQRIKVVALDQLESGRLVEESLGETRADPDLVEGLYIETGGNPLFILESLRAWHETTLEGLGQERLDRRLTLPPTRGVTSVISRRLQSLSAEAKAVLEATAVLGGQARSRLVAAMTGLPMAITVQSVTDLVRRGLLRENAAGYEVPHDQLRRVVLSGIDDAELQAIHERAAIVIEIEQPDLVEDLAYHFAASQVADKAFAYSLQSARKAVALGAYDTAVRQFENAARWAVRDNRYALLTEWEEALAVLGRRSEQHRLLDELAEVAVGPEKRAEVARRRSRLFAEEGNHRQAVELAHEALAESDAGMPPPAKAKLLQNLGSVLARSGRAQDALPHLEAAVEILGSDVASKAAALCELGNVLCEVQEYQRASVALSEAKLLYEDTGDLRGTAEANSQLAIVAMELGDGDTAISLYTAALQISRELDYRRGQAVNLANLANVLYTQGTVGPALGHYEEAASIFSEIGNRLGAALVSTNAASVRYLLLGDASVEADIKRSLAYLEHEDHRWGQAFCHEHLASISQGKGDLQSARDLINRGLALLEEGGHRWVEVHLRRLGVEVELEANQPDQAALQAGIASRICEELGLADVAPTIDSLDALVKLSQGLTEEALRAARRATNTLQRGTELPHLVWFRRYLVEMSAGEDAEAIDSLARAVALLTRILDSFGAEDRRLAMTRSHHVRAIVEARDRRFPQSQEMRLPLAGIPLGRSLRGTDWIQVRWTVSDPSDFDTTDPVGRRRLRIQRFLDEARQQGADPRIEDVATALGVSVATVRRDVAELRRTGSELNTRGSR